jgi:hypothetical protein
MESRDFTGLYESYLGVYEQEIDEVTGGGEVEYKRVFSGSSTRPGVRINPKRENDPYKRKMGSYPAYKTQDKINQLNYERSNTPKESRSKLDTRIAKLQARFDKDGGEMQAYKEEVDLYDLVLEYLLDEGLCESVENAEIMMAHMSEGWVDSIVESYPIGDKVGRQPIMRVVSPDGVERSKIRKGAWGPSDYYMHENPKEIANRRFHQHLTDKEREREQRMAAGRATVARKRGIDKATNRSDRYDRYEDYTTDEPSTDYRARKRRASGR